MAQWYFFLISWQVSDKTLVSSVTSSPELFFVFLFFELHVVLIIKKKVHICCSSSAQSSDYIDHAAHLDTRSVIVSVKKKQSGMIKWRL